MLERLHTTRVAEQRDRRTAVGAGVEAEVLGCSRCDIEKAHVLQPRATSLQKGHDNAT